MRLERNNDLQQFYNNEMTLDEREIWTMSICLFFKINLNYLQHFFHVILRTTCNLYVLEKVQIILLLKYKDFLKTLQVKCYQV